MAQKTREEVKALFKTGAKPSEQDFADFIESTLNIKDDAIEKPSGADTPLKITAQGTDEKLLDFYGGNENTWSINQKPSDDKIGLNISNSGGSRFFIKSSNGNIGIGTQDPQAKLSINGGLHVGGDSDPGDDNLQVDGNLTVNGSISGKIDSAKITSGTLAVERIPNLSANKITSSGTIGGDITFQNVITSPKGINIAGNTEQHMNADGAFYRHDNQVYLTVDDNFYIRDSVSNANIHFDTNSGSLHLSGNVGIGTPDPSHKLHVVALNAVGLFESSTDQAYLKISTVEGLDNRVEIANRPGGRLALWTATEASAFGVDALSISKDGNVGIGVNNPTIKLAIGDSDTGLHQQGDGELAVFTNNHEQIRIDSVGNVGIGTTSPRAKLSINGGLHVGGDSDPGDDNLQVDGNLTVQNVITSPKGINIDGNTEQHMNADGAFYRHDNQVYLTVDDNFYIRDSVSNANIHFDTNSGSLHLSGNVGIGVNNSTIKLAIGDSDTGLHQQGDGELAVFTNNNEQIRINSVGNVGIGTTSPQAKLHVNGYLLERLDVINTGNRGDWANSNHPIMVYFREKLARKPIGTMMRAIQDHPSWRGFYWEAWVDFGNNIRVRHNNFTDDNATATA